MESPEEVSLIGAKVSNVEQFQSHLKLPDCVTEDSCVQIKQAMVNDAQASVASLKSQFSAAKAEAAEELQALEHVDIDLIEHEADSQQQQQSLRYQPLYAEPNSLLNQLLAATLHIDQAASSQACPGSFYLASPPLCSISVAMTYLVQAIGMLWELPTPKYTVLGKTTTLYHLCGHDIPSASLKYAMGVT